MAFVQEYALFLAKAVTLTVIVVGLIAFVAALGARRGSRRGREKLELKRLNDHYRGMGRRIERSLARGRAAKRLGKTERRERRLERRSDARLPRVFVLDFEGDIRATAAESLREEISAVLTAAHDDDEVLLRLESAGGLVHSYGLAASQLARLRERGIRLTVSIDRVAASGGYLMACVADRIIAAPFAIVGSIGVVGQVPNLHKLLRRYDIDYELHTAGEHKRTLTIFGENTDEGREKFRQELAETHELFKGHIQRYRPTLDVERVATGEYWLGQRARDLGLIDELSTSDDFLLQRRERMELVALHFRRRRRLGKRLSLVFESLLGKITPFATEK